MHAAIDCIASSLSVTPCSTRALRSLHEDVYQFLILPVAGDVQEAAPARIRHVGHVRVRLGHEQPGAVRLIARQRLQDSSVSQFSFTGFERKQINNCAKLFENTYL